MRRRNDNDTMFICFAKNYYFSKFYTHVNLYKHSLSQIVNAIFFHIKKKKQNNTRASFFGFSFYLFVCLFVCVFFALTTPPILNFFFSFAHRILFYFNNSNPYVKRETAPLKKKFIYFFTTTFCTEWIRREIYIFSKEKNKVKIQVLLLWFDLICWEQRQW